MQRQRRFKFYFLALLLGVATIFLFRVEGDCSGEAKLIETEIDAIAAAKKLIVEDKFFHIKEMGGAAGFLNSIDQTRDCCRATQSRSLLFEKVWEVSLYGKQGNIAHQVVMKLSSCGKILTDTKFKIKL